MLIKLEQTTSPFEEAQKPQKTLIPIRPQIFMVPGPLFYSRNAKLVLDLAISLLPVPLGTHLHFPDLFLREESSSQNTLSGELNLAELSHHLVLVHHPVGDQLHVGVDSSSNPLLNFSKQSLPLFDVGGPERTVVLPEGVDGQGESEAEENGLVPGETPLHLDGEDGPSSEVHSGEDSEGEHPGHEEVGPLPAEDGLHLGVLQYVESESVEQDADPLGAHELGPRLHVVLTLVVESV